MYGRTSVPALLASAAMGEADMAVSHKTTLAGLPRESAGLPARANALTGLPRRTTAAAGR